MKSRNTKTDKKGALADRSKECSACAICQAVNNEAPGAAWNDNPSQLYAREAENYFFYYQPENQTIKF